MVIEALIGFAVGAAAGWYGRKYFQTEVNQVVDKAKEKVWPYDKP